jgi:membrane-bound lytic murein transglycosylase D
LSPERVPKKVTVRAGKKDTVTSLAMRYKLRPQDVATWNRLTPASALKPGQSVVVYLLKSTTSKSNRKPVIRKRSARSVKK